MSLLAAATAAAGGVAKTIASGGAVAVRSVARAASAPLPKAANDVGGGIAKGGGSSLGAGMQTVAQGALDSGGSGSSRMHDTRSGMEVATEQAALRHGVPPALMKGLVTQESRWNPTIVSSAGAVGLAQLVPKYFKGVDATDPFENVNAGAGYLSSLKGKYGDWATALKAYNAGPTRMDRVLAGKSKLPAETADYVKKVMGYAKAFGWSGSDALPMSAQSEPSNVLAFADSGGTVNPAVEAVTRVAEARPARITAADIPWFATPAPLTPETQPGAALKSRTVKTLKVDGDGNPILPSAAGVPATPDTPRVTQSILEQWITASGFGKPQVRVTEINPDGTDKTTGADVLRGVPGKLTPDVLTSWIEKSGFKPIMPASDKLRPNVARAEQAGIPDRIDPIAPAPAKVPSLGELGTTLADLFGVGFGAVKSKTEEIASTVPGTVETVGSTLAPVGQKFSAEVTDAAFKSAIGTVAGRTAIIDPMIKKVFTDKPGNIKDNPLKYGSSQAERQQAAADRATIQSGLPIPAHTTAVETQLDVSPTGWLPSSFWSKPITSDAPGVNSSGPPDERGGGQGGLASSDPLDNLIHSIFGWNKNNDPLAPLTGQAPDHAVGNDAGANSGVKSILGPATADHPYGDPGYLLSHLPEMGAGLVAALAIGALLFYGVGKTLKA